MKRFQFQLEPVLNYKLQAMDSLLVELDLLQGRVMAQEYKRDEAIRQIDEYEAEFTRRKEEGMTVVEAMECQNCQRVLQIRLRAEQEKLRQLRAMEDAKRSEVIEARKETHSLEKLKELRRNEFDTALMKAEEKSLDDLTAARRAAAQAAAQAAAG